MKIDSIMVGPIMTNCYLLSDETAGVCALIDPGDEARSRLQSALEEGGAVFLHEEDGGLGVRLKFTRKEVRSIRNLENEGGPVGDDDV